ncbi:restriction endonuclease subunit S [Staphylococcus xylosus]|uniref:restriction endonuclease subunit S n=1 Tax=Staphylococcus xylosus TaxID=1288 RepID=UPI00049A54D7|nr:restriction endonuclease subunit S [Staphylococcus xylosus]AID41463.1 Type I restriction-modification system, specificity subunit S [Staphylococcus xylosus]
MEFKLKTLAQINQKSLKKATFPEYIVYLDTKNLTNGKFEELVYFNKSKDKIPSRARRIVQKNDILISTVRPNQKHYGFITKDKENYIVSTGFAVITPDETKVNPYFLYKYLTLDSITNYLQNIAENSTSAYPAIKPSVLSELSIILPDKTIQDYISKLLRSIDDKIDLNEQIIANLEELSQTLFKRWFVDFEFPDENGNPYKSSGGKMIDSELGKIPKNWEISTVKNMSTRINSGGTPSRKIEDYWVNGNIPWLKTKEIKNNIILKTEEKITEKGLIKSSAKFIKEKATVIAMYGATAGKIGYIGKPMTMNQACCAVESDYPIFIYKYFITNSDYIKTLASGSAQQNLNKKTVEELSIIRPEKNILLLFEKLLNNTMEMMKVKIIENSELVKLRDTLLPKLMSGEIEIPDDIEVNEDELSI